MKDKVSIFPPTPRKQSKNIKTVEENLESRRMRTELPAVIHAFMIF